MGHNEQLKALELNIQQRTTNMMSHVGESGSLDSLIQIIRCLDDTNQDVVGLLVRSRDDIHGSQELRELLLDYFSCSHKILEFLNTLHAWLHGGAGVSWRLGRVKSALQSYKSDKTRTGYGRELLQRALNGFMEANDPLVAEQLRVKLRSVMDEQSRLYDRLLAKKHRIEHNWERFHLCRKVTVAVLASVYVGLMLCVALTASLTPASVISPVAVLAAIAAMNPTDYAKTCLNHVLVEYEDKIKRRSELVNALMEANGPITLEDLEGIRHVVESLRDHISSLSAAPPNIIRTNSVVNAMIGDVEKKIDEFAKAVKDLESKKTKCYKDVKDARGKIFRTTCG